VQYSAAKYEAKETVLNSMSRREDNIKANPKKKGLEILEWNSENVFKGSNKLLDSAEGSKYFWPLPLRSMQLIALQITIFGCLTRSTFSK
jgi:hypothetical protein